MAPALLMLLAAPLIDLPAPTGCFQRCHPAELVVVAHAYGLDKEIIAEAITWSTAIVVLAALVSLLF